MQLFVDRARAVRASFTLTVDNASDVAAICRHLDGLPLAIELAAARSKLLGPRALLTRLDQALDLRATDADRPTRQQALRERSTGRYRLLPAPQQALFRRLGVCAGGADLDAVAAVCADGTVGDRDPTDLVADLVDASLVTVDRGRRRRAPVHDVGDAERSRSKRSARPATSRRRGGCTPRTSQAWPPSWTGLDLATREHMIRGNRLFHQERNNFREALAWATSPSAKPCAVERIAVDGSGHGFQPHLHGSTNADTARISRSTS